jgi:hypothetical protein
MINLPEAVVKASCTDMEKAPDTIGQGCSKCGKALRPITSMLEPKSGRTFHMLVCECGEKSWTADNKAAVGISDAPR